MLLEDRLARRERTTPLHEMIKYDKWGNFTAAYKHRIEMRNELQAQKSAHRKVFEERPDIMV